MKSHVWSRAARRRATRGLPSHVCLTALTATCDKWENGKPISSIYTGRAIIEHGAKSDSDLARPPGGDHPATQQASPCVLRLLTRRAARCGRLAAKQSVCTRAPMTQSEARHCSRMLLPGRIRDREGAGRRRTGPDRRKTGAGGSGADPGRRLSGGLAEHSVIG